jgi:hypothetical protein
LDHFALIQLPAGSRNDRIDDVIDVDERKLELAISENEPPAPDSASDCPGHQRNATTEDLAWS